MLLLTSRRMAAWIFAGFAGAECNDAGFLREGATRMALLLIMSAARGFMMKLINVVSGKDVENAAFT
jgi:hypothetical protein